MSQINTPENNLYRVAAAQQGYFTTGQAISAGYQDAVHPYHVKKGDWVREWRGIYRLARYPQSDDAHYVLWYLWSRNRQGIPQGVYSHRTALVLFDCTDSLPAKIHMTVPPSFRRHSRIPDVLALHRGKYGEDETVEREGFRVTGPARTIVDLLQEDGMLSDTVRQAYRELRQRGLVMEKDFMRYRNLRGIGAELNNLMKGAG